MIRTTYVPPAVNAGLVVHAALGEAAEAAAREVFDESQRLVPVDTGALKDSGRITREDGARAAISYGQADGAGRDGQDTSAYAVPVHERMDATHTTGQAKYLEVALHAAAGRAAEAVAVTLRRAIDR